MTDSLAIRGSIDQLYSVFRSYVVAPHVDSCPHCVDESDHALLASKRLRDLSGTDLSKFALKAITTWGNASTFKHFLPRLFELLFFAELPVNGEIVAGKLRLAEWNQWPAPERAAIRGFFAAWFADAIDDPRSEVPGWRASECLFALGCALDDVGPLLDSWRMTAATSRSAAQTLASFAFECAGPMSQGKSINAFWSELPHQASVLNWLLERATTDVLETMFFAASDGDAILSEGIEAIGWIRSAVCVSPESP